MGIVIDATQRFNNRREREIRLRDLAAQAARLYTQGFPKYAANIINIIELKEKGEFMEYLQEYMDYYNE